jgi:hypothetical protein
MIESYNATKKRDILTPEPNIAPFYLPFFNQPSRNKLGCVDPNGKANPLCSKNHSCIDADDISSGCDQRSSGVSWIQGGVSLKDVVYETA